MKAKFIYGFLILSLALVLSAGKAHATAISASVAIIKEIRITGIDIAFDDQFSFSAAEVDSFNFFTNQTQTDDADSGNIDGWVKTFALAHVPTAFVLPDALGAGITLGDGIVPDDGHDDGRLAEAVFAKANGIITEANAFATAGLFSTFTALEAGYLNVSADFILAQALITSIYGDLAEGFATAGFFFENDDAGTDDTQFAELDNFVSFGDPNYFALVPGTLTASLYFNEFDFGFLDFLVFNEAHVQADPIPEPSTYMLMGMGILGMVGWRRRQIKGIINRKN